jgi:lipoprotein-anchoring transpeptidase ErfK/SrfK
LSFRPRLSRGALLLRRLILLGTGIMNPVLLRTALALIMAAAIVSPHSARAATRDVVAFSGFAPGTIVVKTAERRLYFVIDSARALRFPVGVGRAGMTWSGSARVEGKFIRPAWSPPDMIRRENPRLPEVIPGGAANNPMGDAALTLRGGEYAIHGTNRPSSVGGFVSHGCIRMYNSDIRELYRLVSIGTPVIVEQ